jgi:hypothetical protein
MNENANKNLNIIASLGLALGGIFGMAGTFAGQANLRNISWGIDGLGIIVATSLLATKYFRKGCDFVAAGFLVFAIAEAIILSGTAAGLEASAPSFSAGAAMWATAILMVSIPAEFPLWTRLIGCISSALFYITAAKIFWGAAITPISAPLPFFAYPFLVLTFIGWIVTLVKENIGGKTA